MTVHRFLHDDKILKFDTDSGVLLMSTRWRAGRDQTRWIELYSTPGGRFVLVNVTLWQGEEDAVRLIEPAEALHHLALAAPGQRTDEGDALLDDADPAEDI